MTPLDKLSLFFNFFTFFFLIFIIVLVFLKIKKFVPGLRFASAEKTNGIIFGKKWGRLVSSPPKAEGHIAVFGGSGLGKTSAILIPTIESWGGTSFSIDISGDIYSNVHRTDLLIYEPDHGSTPYHIFAPIDVLTNQDDQNEALEQLAFQLMPEDPNMKDAARFFHVEGRKILTAALICFYHEGLDFIEICDKVVGSSWKDLFDQIDRTGYQKGIRYINSFVGSNEQNTAGCKQAADSALKLFATNEKIKRSIHRPIGKEPYFSPEKIETSSVFISVEDRKLSLYAPLLHIITAQTLEYFSSRPNGSRHPILLCLDEFASFGRLEITDALRKLRKKNVRIMTLTQSLADLDLIYGRSERMAMLNNFAFKVVLGASDTETQEYFAKLIGKQDQINILDPERPQKEWIIEPSDFAHLRNELVLLHPDGHIRLKKNYYFKK